MILAPIKRLLLGTILATAMSVGQGGVLDTTAPIVIWSPQEGPQTALLQCPVFEVFCGVARGGGKTDGMIGDWLQHSQLYGENAVGVFVRRNRTQLSEVIARTKQIFLKFLGPDGKQLAKYNEQKSEWLMPGG